MIDQNHKHTPEAIKARLAENIKINYLREWVYGGIDGVVTTFAIVSGVVGASLSPHIVIILGLANLIGDGFSMAAGAYTSSKTTLDDYDRLRKVEQSHIAQNPCGEKEEIRQIYAKKGFSGGVLEEIVETISDNNEQWISIMMAEEYGLSPALKSPLMAGIHTFIAFLLCGFMPLIPFVFNVNNAFEWAFALSALSFFAIGAFKSQWSIHRWWDQGLKTMLIGLIAAGSAFAIGYGLRGLGL
tara:strand:+ start:16142 stop:16867 length:726 start_codon:yes stop_codon:yes gene_type:complete